MRRSLADRRSSLVLATVLAAACAKPADKAADTTGTAAASTSTAPAPAQALTAKDVAGKWNGATMLADRDSVLYRWGMVSTSDSTGKLAIAGSKDSIPFTTHFDGDSLVAVSSPFPMTPAKGAPKITFHSVGRLKDGKLVGTLTHNLASRPDSVVERRRWEATRAQ